MSLNFGVQEQLLTPREGQDPWEGFKKHLYFAFREFDINYYETYVFVIVIGFTMLWAVVTVLQTICNWNSEKKKENQALVLLRDDL